MRYSYTSLLSHPTSSRTSSHSEICLASVLALWHFTPLGILKWHHIDACCGSAGKSTEHTSPFWKKSEKKRDFWRTSNDGNCSLLDTRRERTTCALPEGDGQTTSETGWDHQSQNAQEWHRNVNYGEQCCRWAKSSTFSNEDDLVQSVLALWHFTPLGIFTITAICNNLFRGWKVTHTHTEHWLRSASAGYLLT